MCKKQTILEVAYAVLRSESLNRNIFDFVKQSKIAFFHKIKKDYSPTNRYYFLLDLKELECGLIQTPNSLL